MRYVVTLSLALCLTFAGVAHADVDVVPDSHRPSVNLKGTKEKFQKRQGGSKKEDKPGAQQPKKDSSPTVPCSDDQDSCSDAEIEELLDEYAIHTKKEVTLGDIRKEVRRIGLPAVDIGIQPASKTLVNLETIFYADVSTFERDVEILDFNIGLKAEPVNFVWHYGDGSQETTQSPGRRYPNENVTHKYRAKADEVHPRVDVSYQVTFRVDSKNWQTLPDIIEVPGNAGSLKIDEGRPVLTQLAPN